MACSSYWTSSCTTLLTVYSETLRSFAVIPIDLSVFFLIHHFFHILYKVTCSDGIMTLYIRFFAFSYWCRIAISDFMLFSNFSNEGSNNFQEASLSLYYHVMLLRQWLQYASPYAEWTRYLTLWIRFNEIIMDHTSDTKHTPSASFDEVCFSGCVMLVCLCPTTVPNVYSCGIGYISHHIL